MNRTIKHMVQGYRTKDGAGVSLVRVLGPQTIDAYDPILMLDSFDSTNPSEYMAGFPMHPHRGIETITYLQEGSMKHKDSLGNSGTIMSGGVQWMTAGSGILHEEMPESSERLLGVQLWLNLPQKEKMDKPAYHDLPKESMPVVTGEGYQIKIVGGSYGDVEGFKAPHHPLTMYAIHLEKDAELTLDVPENDAAILFTLQNDALICNEEVREKTAVLTSTGDKLTLGALDTDADILYLSAPRLNEEVSWGGPIVMNTDEELKLAFAELRQGTFIKDDAE